MSVRVEHLAEGVTVYCGDCREIVPGLAGIDAVIADPPYGMSWDTNTRRFTGGNNPNDRCAGRHDEAVISGDSEPFDPSPWLGYPEAILWGANHFAARLPKGTTLVWLKKLDSAFGTFLSDAELAWQKGGHGVYCLRDLSMNAEASRRVHPTQKPLALMSWCVRRVSGAMILDPFMGSGTTGVAAVNMGRKFVGIELDAKHFETALRRISEALKQPDMFIEKPSPVKQGMML